MQGRWENYEHGADVGVRGLGSARNRFVVGEPFALGSYVQSGAEVLQCTGRGVWLRKGEQRPEIESLARYPAHS